MPRGSSAAADPAQQQRHAVPAQVGVLAHGGAGGLVDDLAEPLGEHRLVRVLEADAQELLPGPLAQPLRQPGQPLRGAERGQRGLHQAAQPVHDAVAVALQLVELVGQYAQPGGERGGPGGRVVGQRGRGQLPDLLAGGGAHLLVADRVGVPYEDVGGLAQLGLGGGQVGGAAAQAAAGLGGGPAGLLQTCPGTARVRPPRPAPCGPSRSRSRSIAAVSSKPPAASSAARWACTTSAWAVRVCSNASVARGEFGGGGAQQLLGVLGVARRAARSGRSVCASPSAGARRSASPRSRPNCSLAADCRLSRVCTSCSARAAAAWRDGPSEPSGPSSSWAARLRTLLVSRSSSASAAFSVLSARACSARRSAPTPTFSYSSEAARYASRSAGSAVTARVLGVRLRGVVGGAGDLGALGAQHAGGAAGVVGGALGGAAVLVGGPGPRQARLGARLGLGRVGGQLAAPALPVGPLAQPVGESGEQRRRGGGPARRRPGGRRSRRRPPRRRPRPPRAPRGSRRAGPGRRSAASLAAATSAASSASRPCGQDGAPRREPGGERTVVRQPGGQRPDLLLPGGRPGPQPLAFAVGGDLVVHRRVRRYEEDVRGAVGGRGRGEQGGGGADGHGGARQQRGPAERLLGPRVRARVGDDDAVDQFGPGRQHRGVVGGVHGLREVAPAGQRGDAVLAEVLDGGQDVGAGRQQSPVAEGAQDARVVGGGGAQVEQLPLRGRHRVVQQLAQRVGEGVQLRGGRVPARAVGGPGGTAPRAARRPSAARARRDSPAAEGRRGRGRAAPAAARPLAAGRGRGHAERRAGRSRRGSVDSAVAATVAAEWAASRGGEGVGGAGRGQFGAASAEAASRARAAADGRGLGGAAGQARRRSARRRRRPAPRGPGRRRARSRPASRPVPPRAVSCSTSASRCPRWPLSLRARCAAVAAAVASRCAFSERAWSAAERSSSSSACRSAARGGAVQGAYEVGRGLGAGREGGRGVPFRLADRGGDPGQPVAGGAVPQYGLGGLPGGVPGAGVGEFAAQGRGALLGGGRAPARRAGRRVRPRSARCRRGPARRR